MTSPPPHYSQPFQPPGQGQPFQPPHPGAPVGAQQPSYVPPAQALGPPPNASAGPSPFRLPLVGILALVVLGVSYWMGTYLAVYGRSGLTFYVLILPVAVAVGALMAVWSDTAYQVRAWGSDLFGRTVLGWRRLDLANLTSVGVSGSRGQNTILLRDGQGQIAFSGKKLEPVIEGVRRGVFEAAQQGRFMVPTRLAEILGLPVQPGAPKSGRSPVLALLAAIGLLLVGLVVGLAAAS